MRSEFEVKGRKGPFSLDYNSPSQINGSFFEILYRAYDLRRFLCGFFCAFQNAHELYDSASYFQNRKFLILALYFVITFTPFALFPDSSREDCATNFNDQEIERGGGSL